MVDRNDLLVSEKRQTPSIHLWQMFYTVDGLGPNSEIIVEVFASHVIRLSSVLDRHVDHPSRGNMVPSRISLYSFLTHCNHFFIDCACNLLAKFLFLTNYTSEYI